MERAMGYGLGIARALSNLGEIAEVMGELVQAVRLFTAAEYLFEQVKSPYAAYAADLRANVAARLNETASDPGPEMGLGFPDQNEGRSHVRSADELIVWALQTPSEDAARE